MADDADVISVSIGGTPGSLTSPFETAAYNATKMALAVVPLDRQVVAAGGR